MKKQQIVALAVGLCAVGTLFTGCHMRHEWTAATCTEPETCAVGGETRGEALGHTWVEATCTEPKTCSVCGATDGEALAHTFAEANYQQPATCTVCGETEGDVLPAEFDTYGLSCDAIAGEAYTYKTIGYTDSSVEVIGTVTFQEPEMVDGCEYFETPDGYVCVKATILMSFDDNNARSYGIQWSYCMEDYYAIVAHDDSGVTDDNGVLTCTVNWDGVDYTECHTYLAESSGQWDDSVFNTKITFYYSLPDGYDGAVLGVCNPSVEWEEGMYIFDVDNTDMVLYRLPALTAAN